MVASPLSGGEPAITGSLIEIDALRALGLATSGEDAAAVDALAAALTLASEQGYVRVFADEGPPMAALLAELIAAQRSGGAVAENPLGWLARLQRAFDVGHTRPGPRSGMAPAAVPGLVEQLTSRELEVLGMLAAGWSNQAIAGQLAGLAGKFSPIGLDQPSGDSGGRGREQGAGGGRATWQRGGDPPDLQSKRQAAAALAAWIPRYRSGAERRARQAAASAWVVRGRRVSMR